LQIIMPKKIVLKLTSKERQILEDIVRKGENWRVRERAKTILHFDEGLSAEEVAQIMELHVRTVSTTRTGWLAQGMESLPDKARTGAPEKLPLEQSQKVVEWARAQPGSARDLQNRLESEGGLHVHLNTIRATLRRAGMVFKRTRHSLKKNEIRRRS
jgi:transposase